MINVIVRTWITPEIDAFLKAVKPLRFPITIVAPDGSQKSVRVDFERIRMWFGWEGALTAIGSGRGESRIGDRVSVWHIGQPCKVTMKGKAALAAMIASPAQPNRWED